jgi:hypothetical protein
MVIDNFNFVCVTFAPAKANPPLVVDSDAVLSVAIAFEFFETIAWRHAKIVQRFGGIKQGKLPEGGPVKFSGESLDFFALKEQFRVLIGESPDHCPIITRGATTVKRQRCGKQCPS